MANTLGAPPPHLLSSSSQTHAFRQPTLHCFHSQKLFLSHNSNLFLSCSRINAPGTTFLSSSGLGFPIDDRKCSTRAFHVNDAGSIDQLLMEAMEKKIKEELNAEFVSVKDAYGDGRHVCIDVISSAFEGQSDVKRQRMVYNAIRDELHNTIHAVDEMSTRTPIEAKSE